MAWMVKNSAGMAIERRAEPYLTESMKERLEAEVLSRYPTRRAALLSVLHTIQEENSWIPHQALEEVAEFLGLTTAEVLDTTSFYEEFHLRPPGRYVIQICQSISCELMGQKPLLERLKRELNVDVGQTTADGKFTLMTVECLGVCEKAPAALISGKAHGRLDADACLKILANLE